MSVRLYFANAEEFICVGPAVLVEKDFVCLDGRDADNEDAFENPNTGQPC